MIIRSGLAALACAVTRYVGRGLRATWVAAVELRASSPSSLRGLLLAFFLVVFVVFVVHIVVDDLNLWQ